MGVRKGEFTMEFPHSKPILNRKKNLEISWTKRDLFLLETVFEIGQGHIFNGIDESDLGILSLQTQLKWLDDLETFFCSIQGLKGLQKKIEELCRNPVKLAPKSTPFQPYSLKEGAQSTENGILLQGQLVEIMVLGGAAERLNFFDSLTNKPLPAFLYPFMGKTLLEWFFLDLEAKEELYYKKTNKKIYTPVVLMASNAKDNVRHLENYLESENYFNRPKETIEIVLQPMVPYVDSKGMWVVNQELNLEKGPCGHGAIWKLLKESKIIQTFSNEKKWGLIRQINNPILSFYDTMPLFVDTLFRSNQHLSILVTEPLEGAKEGKVVKKEDGRLVNFEYIFSPTRDLFGFANVNAIAFSLDQLPFMVQDNPYPGLLLNFKNSFKARLEMTMQDILESTEKSIAVYQVRQKALLPIKNSSGPLETKLWAFEKFQEGFREFFQVEHGTFLLHPFYTKTKAWLQNTQLAPDVFLEINRKGVELIDCSIQGALIIEIRTKKSIAVRLKNVKVENRGLDFLNKDHSTENFVFASSCKILIDSEKDVEISDLVFKEGACFNI